MSALAMSYRPVPDNDPNDAVIPMPAELRVPPMNGGR